MRTFLCLLATAICTNFTFRWLMINDSVEYVDQYLENWLLSIIISLTYFLLFSHLQQRLFTKQEDNEQDNP
ncbi:hypothetical protein [Psychrobium sp. 1_MG-2023]|uniref:hypothetical protein n=1 Tax=Psychrobium sp. 1_MG-2023 TaxID=3062624 RepID=UPI000C333217|nr:hypothetical protein [Psychrobium sp. 1_MG-2023]MDP2559661.1 hypothetical protein [Psychrobium sp. 1_MG-2023]PKF59492.1 hypothetical protein CW748_01600 [Alteromonadales bacterium alter-6D02]